MSLKQERSSSGPQYPTPAEIEATFTKVESPEELQRVQEFFASDFRGVVTGHDHSFVGEHQGHGSWFEQLSSILDTLEHEKTFKLDIVRVIGGGSSAWASMEAKATAKTKTGESPCCFLSLSLSLSLSLFLPFIPNSAARELRSDCLYQRLELGMDYNNEFVWIMHFNDEGKIDKARAYYDSAHMEELAKEMKAQQ